MNNAAKTLCSGLILLLIIAGPLWLGSYYKPWREYFTYSTITFIALTPPISLLHKKRKKTTKQPSKWIVIISTTILICQGIFMWHNSWGTFSVEVIEHGFYRDWKITPLENQPYYNLPGSADKAEAWDRLSYIIPCLLLTLCTRHLISKRLLNIRTLCAGIFWTGTGIALLGLLQRFTEADATFWNDQFLDKNQPLFFATFRSPGIACSYLNICLAVGLSHLLATTHKLTKNSNPKPTHPILISVGLMILFAGSICAGSKAGAAFAILTLLLWTLFNLKGIIKLISNASSLFPSGSPHERNIVISATLIAFTLAALSFGTTVTKRWENAAKGNYDTLQQRQTANEIQIKMIKDPQWSKIAGFGPGSFYPMFHFYKQDSNLWSTWVYAHNDHLQTLVEWGWLGTGCFAIIIGGGCYLSLTSSLARKRKFHTSDKFYFKGITLAMLICLLHATVDFPFQIESIAITFSIILGIAWASPSLQLSKKRKTKSA